MRKFLFKIEANTLLVEIHKLEHKARNLVKFNFNIKKSRTSERLKNRYGKRKRRRKPKLPEMATLFLYLHNEIINSILSLNKHSILN